MAVIDTFVAYKFLKILTTPWKNTEAYKLGIIDENGEVLRSRRMLTTNKEKSAYTIFHQLVWNIRRLLERLPTAKIGTFAAALWMLKEHADLIGADSKVLLELAVEELDAAGIPKALLQEAMIDHEMVVLSEDKKEVISELKWHDGFTVSTNLDVLGHDGVTYVLMYLDNMHILMAYNEDPAKNKLIVKLNVKSKITAESILRNTVARALRKLGK